MTVVAYEVNRAPTLETLPLPNKQIDQITASHPSTLQTGGEGVVIVDGNRNFSSEE